MAPLGHHTSLYVMTTLAFSEFMKDIFAILSNVDSIETENLSKKNLQKIVQLCSNLTSIH